ncbi:MAG: ParB N-terminal domain-containing protein [Nitrososphaerales archaeon]
MSVDDDQLKAKIGQILYNNYITDRLREEVLQRVAHRNSLALRMSLGKDSNGEEVYLDILVNRSRPEIEQLKKSVKSDEVRIGDLKKYTAIILSSNASPNTDNMTIATNFEYLMSQSLNWWARYSGSRDNLNVDKWKIEHAYTVDTKEAFLIADIPIENITVPESRKFEVGDLGKYTQHLEALPPVMVRQRDNGRFELIEGFHILQAYMKAGRREVPAEIKSVSDDEAETISEGSRRMWEKLLVKSR